MEKSVILIMENLGTIYPSMYDLFNQNFTVFSNKNYARLALGSSTTTYSLVNSGFRCIINVDLNQIDNEETPFLNRFEKQIISFETLLNKELLEESNRIYNILNDLIERNNLYKGINYDLINCDIEEIRGMVYNANKKGINKEKIIDEILSKISLTLPQDIFLFLKYNGFIQKHRVEYNKINDYYKGAEHINLSRFIRSMKTEKNIIYTFSNNLEELDNISNIDNQTFGKIYISNIKELKISSLFSEVELETEIDDFLSNEYKLCIIQLTSEEGKFMNYIKCMIENKEKEYINKQKESKKGKKVFIFIVYMTRVFYKELNDYDLKSEKEKKEINKKILKETISNLSGYYQTFIDNLNGDENLSLENILQMKGNEIFRKCLDLDKELIKNIYPSLFYMKYTINYPSIGKLNKNTYVNKFIHYIENNKSLREVINDCIIKEISDIKGDLISQIFNKKNIFEENDVDIINVVKKYLLYLYKKQLNLLIFKSEKDLIFATLLSFNEIDNINNLLFKDF